MMKRSTLAAVLVALTAAAALVAAKSAASVAAQDPMPVVYGATYQFRSPNAGVDTFVAIDILGYLIIYGRTGNGDPLTVVPGFNGTAETPEAYAARYEQLKGTAVAYGDSIAVGYAETGFEAYWELMQPNAGADVFARNVSVTATSSWVVTGQPAGTPLVMGVAVPYPNSYFTLQSVSTPTLGIGAPNDVLIASGSAGWVPFQCMELP